MDERKGERHGAKEMDERKREKSKEKKTWQGESNRCEIQLPQVYSTKLNESNVLRWKFQKIAESGKWTTTITAVTHQLRAIEEGQNDTASYEKKAQRKWKINFSAVYWSV